MNACDPDADIENLRKLIKINAGVDIKLTKKEICEAYQDIQDGKLPLPPLVMNSTRTYLVDKKSPLKPNDYELLFDSTTKRADLKRVARKVNLKNVEQMTKSQIVDAIGKRLRYMKVHEPVKFARKRRVSVNTNTNTAVNNTAVSNVNNANFNINRVNTNVNTNRVNTNVNRVNTNVNTNMNRVNTNVNRVNTNVNRVNTNMNRVNTNVNRPKERNSKVTFPSGGLFTKGRKPKFLGGVKEPVGNKKPGFFAKLFGKKEKKNFVPAKKFNGSKEGYVFRKGEKGLGYYLNTGAVQGPQIPTANIIQPTPTNGDFSLDLAVARVKQLGLKREQQFLNKIQLGRRQRKQIVVEAEQAKEEENQFMAYLEQLNISNTNRNSFKRRMATDDFKQLRVEAQLKADDKANVIRSNEEKMALFLKTTSLTNTNQTLFLNRARKEGSNINALIEEARKLNSDIKSKKLSNKQDEFRKILQNYNKLNASDKEALIASVTETMNVNSLRKMADELLQKRIEEKQNLVAQNLLSFLTPLQINQKNKNDFLRRFRNEGANINTIKSEALKLQESKGSSNLENLRVRLETRLNEISLNQLNKNAIMRKFTNGNRNVDKLIEEAKNLKKRRNDEGLNKAQKEYRAYLNTLPGLTNGDKQQLMNNGSMNRNKAVALSNQRISNKKQSERNGFSQFLTELGLNNNDRANMMSQYNSEKLTVNALRQNAQTLKNKRVTEQKALNKQSLKNYMNRTDLSTEVKTNIEKRFNANQSNLRKLQAEINKMVKNAQNTKLANNKAKFTNYVRTTILSQTNQNAFIRKLNANNVNVSSLRQEVNAMVSRMVQVQRDKDRDELDEYMKTKGLTNGNRKTILNKFNVNSEIALKNLKQEANAIVISRIQERKNANTAELREYVRELGLNNQDANALVTKLNRNSLNSLKTEADRIAKKKAQNRKNTNRRNLNAYMNEIGLNTNNKEGILRKNVSLNEGKKLANQTLQMRIRERREKNVIKLKLHLNNLNLTNEEKRKFYNNFNKNVNLNTIKSNASSLAASKKAQIKAEQVADLKAFMNVQGLTGSEQRPFANRLNKNQDDLNALKLEVEEFASEKFKSLKAKARQDLVKYLSKLSLDQSNVNGILKNFDNTNVNSNVLKKRAKEINKSRKNQRYAQDESEFFNYLNTLQNLTAENRTEITSKLNGYFTNWNSIKKEATDTAVQRAKERRAREKSELNNYLTNLGFNNNTKRNFFKNLDDGKKNLSTLKKNAVAYRKQLNNNAKAGARKGFSNFLNTLYLNNSDRAAFLEQFNDGTTSLNRLQQNARQKEVKTIEEKKGELFVYLSELGLEAPDRNLILKNFNADPRSVNNLRNKGRQIKNARNEERRMEIRRELKAYLNGLNLLTNKNKQNILNKNLSLNNGRAEGNRAQEFKKLAKRNVNTTTLKNSIRNLSNKDQTYLLNKFETRNVTLNSVLKEAEDLRKKRSLEKRSRERNELYNFVNKLDMNVADRNSIMNKFNKTNATVNTLKNAASQLRNKRTSEKRALNRSELSGFLNTLNLSGTNKKGILNRFNVNKNASLTSLRTNAEELQKQRGIEKRLANREEVSRYLTTLGLSNANSQIILNKFNTNKSVTTTNARKEANALLQQRIKESVAANREDLVSYMNTLNLTNANKSAILKNFDSEVVSLNKLKNRAANINSRIKTKASERQELSNYINELGINGTVLLQKLNDGRSTLNRLKQDARKMRNVSDAQMIKNKKEKLRDYMKETRLKNTNKQSFLNRVELNTNMDEIKREVRELNTVLKTMNEEIARKRSELSVFLDTLNDLTNAQRVGLVKKVVSANTNIQPLKLEGDLLNKAVKNKRAEQQRLNKEKKRKEEESKRIRDEKKLEKHLRSLKHLTSKEMEGYMTDFKNGKGLINDLIAVSKAKNADNEKDKDIVRNYVRKADIPQFKKDVYLKQLNAPHVNATPIKGLVNVNVATQKVEIQKLIKKFEAKLKKLSNITPDERAVFKNRLKTESVSDVFKKAEKLNASRKAVRQAKDKMIKNTAKSLQTLTDLTRNNRKMFMNRLNKNGQKRVIMNAVALNDERKKVKRDEESARKIEAEKKRLEEEAQKRRNAEALRIKKLKEQEMKNVASRLQGLTSLERENRKKFMNRLATNGPQKVLSNATKLDANRKADARQIRGGVETKLKKIGVSGSNLKTLMKRWNDSKNKTIFDDARKMISTKRQPLINKVKRVVPASNNMSQARQKWEAAIREAENDASLQKIERLLESKLKLKARTESEVKDLPPREQSRYLKNFMAYRDDLSQKTQELDRIVKTKRDTKDRATKETATKLQSMNKLGRDNRKRFMNRVAGGENARKVLTNADKLQRNRSAKQRLEAERKQREQQQAQQRKDREQKTREYEKQKQTKLRGNTARMLQGMSGLERRNRQEFMQRLERGEDPARVISNAQRRDASKRVRPTSGPVPQQGRIAPRTKKMKAKNRTRVQVSRQQQRRRR
ncbi:hypothetical protein OlV7_150 [Ostreococcus lucimarinus virus 7]|uniref:hypothetical protein n=1 Tax=Ostreococcus lucimarinus virus 7 TaxID=1663209 RepID=UPI0006D13DD3|nr:hypothetical protein AP054_gp150 [Ostreococcus lucimarinus virus 7]ALI95782.1 hypothetical protein OlV7_150 [Ostreococcus lucimarinus virus 7]QBP06844.1 hypothetical protein OlV7_gene150 [Ostreococcus lucimarinus virus 7]